MFAQVQLMTQSFADQAVIGLQALIAGLLGAIVGFERGKSGKGVGLRTHALVAIASSAAVGLGGMLVSSVNNGDPSRTLHAIITGVGFIGAGAILHSPQGTQGVTTATSVLLVAVIGASVGVGMPIIGVCVTVLALLVLRVVGTWQHHRNESGNANTQGGGGESHMVS
jgi:putative Mg2+ transporter-C (MgtC) family protein